MPKYFCFTISPVLLFIVATNLFAQTEKLLPFFKIGDVEVVAVQDGRYDFSTTLFYEVDQDILKKIVPDGIAEGSTMTFLLKRNDGTKILVDTGIGRFGPEKPMLVENLAKTGVKPEDITTILLTHMHSDHIGGLLNGDDRAFSNATVRCSKPEYDFWTDKKSLDKMLETVDKSDIPFVKQQFELVDKVVKVYGKDFLPSFEFDTKPVSGFPELTALDANGHTPGHTTFLLESKGEKFLIIADLLHAAAIQFPYPQAYTRFDMNPTSTVMSRKRLLDKAANENISIGGMHLPTPGIGRVRRSEAGGYIFTPITLVEKDEAIRSTPN